MITDDVSFTPIGGCNWMTIVQMTFLFRWAKQHNSHPNWSINKMEIYCKSIKTYLRILELLWWYIQQNNRHIFCHIKPLCFINTVRIMKWWKQPNMLIPQTKCLQRTVSQILTIKHKFSLQTKLATTGITPLCIPVPQVSIRIIY
jgi:hypothetical protein